MKNPHKKQILRLLSLLAVDGLFFSLTQPDKVPAQLLIVAFCLVALTAYQLIAAGVAVLAVSGLPIKRHKLLRIHLTGAVALIIALQSASGLAARDVMVLIPLALMGYFYSSYAKKPSSELEM